jgi:hypothetical protein
MRQLLILFVFIPGILFAQKDTTVSGNGMNPALQEYIQKNTDVGKLRELGDKYRRQDEEDRHEVERWAKEHHQPADTVINGRRITIQKIENGVPSFNTTYGNFSKPISTDTLKSKQDRIKPDGR